MRVLTSDPEDRLAAALARLGRAFIGRPRLTGLHVMQGTLLRWASLEAR